MIGSDDVICELIFNAHKKFVEKIDKIELINWLLSQFSQLFGVDKLMYNKLEHIKTSERNDIVSEVVTTFPLDLKLKTTRISCLSTITQSHTQINNFIVKITNTQKTMLFKPDVDYVPQMIDTCFICSVICIPLITNDNVSSIITLIDTHNLFDDKETVSKILIAADRLIYPLSSIIYSYNLIAIAKETTESKDSFLANISHEIRTPLNGILSITNLMYYTPLNEQQMEYINIIQRSSRDLMEIINDILDVIQIESQNMQIKSDSINLRECIESSIDVISSMALEKKLNLSLYIKPEVPIHILSDYTRLRQIVINLLNNAVKFTERGQIDVIVDAERVTDTKYNIMVRIRDTGIGISQNDTHKLFKLFSQIDQSNTKRYEGTGMGLAISRKLAELLNGDLWLENSEIGKGSTFILKFLTDEVKLEIDEFKQYLHIIAGKKALIVDDNITNRISLCSLLSGWGIICTSCASAEEALLLYAGKVKFDIGIIDIRMPVHNGYEIANKIVNSDNRFPLIAMSSEKIKIKEIPFISIVIKPIKEHILLKNIVNTFQLGSVTDIGTRNNTTHHYITNPKLSILMAEDKETNQYVFNEMIKNFGYKPAKMCNDGVEAYDEIKCNLDKYDVIMIDIKMPRMDGVELSTKLHEIYATIDKEKRPMIIGLTALALRTEKEKYMNQGYFDEYLTKPIDSSKLLSVLNSCRVLHE